MAESMQEVQQKEHCMIFELRGSSGFLPTDDLMIEVGNRKQWKQIRKHYWETIQKKFTRFSVLSKEKRAELLKTRCAATHWDWSVPPVIAKPVKLKCRMYILNYSQIFWKLKLPSLKWGLCAYIRHVWWWTRMPNTYWEDYYPVIDELFLARHMDQVFIPPKTEAFWNAETIKEESAKIGLIPHSQIWIFLMLFNYEKKVRWVQLAHKRIDKEFHDNLDKQRAQETVEDRKFPPEEQFVVAEEEYPTAPKLRDHEFRAVLDAIDELVEKINDPANDQWNSQQGKIFFKDIFCPEEKEMPPELTTEADENGKPFHPREDRDSDFP